MPARGVARMRRHLMVHLPLAETVTGRDFERVLAGGVGGQVVGTGAPGGGKHLFDVLSGPEQTSHGFSAKTLSCGRESLEGIKGGKRDWLFVLRRSDVIAHGEQVSSPSRLGRRLVDDFNAHRRSSIETQGVVNPSMSLLLRSSDERQHLYFETECNELVAEQLKWSWTDDTRRSVSGHCKGCGKLMYRYYLAHRQLFGAFQVPENAVAINTPWRRMANLPVDELYEMLYPQGD